MVGISAGFWRWPEFDKVGCDDNRDVYRDINRDVYREVNRDVNCDDDA
jgi:hypothetical protein